MSQNLTTFRLGHRPFLDGIRGIAIILVMLFHLREPILPGGHIGVNIFFVLSGFLITSILMDEWGKTNGIDFRRFYLRRALRLFPALFVLVAGVVAIKSTSHLVGISYWEGERSIWWSASAAIFYFANWVKAFSLFELGALTHTWSLSIEEQFYLLWPVSLFGMLRAGWSHEKMIKVLGGAALFSVILRYVLFQRNGFERVYDGLDTRADALLIGSLLAVVMAAGITPRSLNGSRVLNALTVVSGVFLAYIAVFTDVRAAWLYEWGGLCLSAIATACIMYRFLVMPVGIGNAFLSSQVLGGFGMISYGLYLWHFPIFWAVNQLGLPSYLNAPIGIAVAIGVAIVSYRVIEQPFLRLKDRIPVREREQAQRSTQAASPSPV